MSVLKVNCPRCQQIILWDDQHPYKPFCSERCKNIDLGAWADESYNIPGTSSPLPNDEDES